MAALVFAAQTCQFRLQNGFLHYTSDNLTYILRQSGKIWGSEMGGHSIHHFQNDAGHPTINIGVRKFMCVGANPPFDHPHEYLDMGDADEIVCPYCSTLYRYDATLDAAQTNPNGCIFTVADT